VEFIVAASVSFFFKGVRHASPLHCFYKTCFVH
jgi:hypothetical protein